MMGGLTGTGTLARFALRHDRVRILVWIASLVLLVAVTAASTKGLYATQADLDKAAVASQDNSAAIAFNGPAVGLDTLGGQIAFQVGAFGLTMVGLMTLLMTSRLTRGEEEAGQVELIRSMPVGRFAPAAAAAVVVVGMNVAVGALSTITLLGQGLPVAGSLALGASFLALGLVFVAVTAVTAQVTENVRVTSGLAGAVLGASFVVRAAGDIGGGTWSWLSPIGWSQKIRPYAGEAWWTVAVPVLVTAGLLVGAFALASRRDFGGGLVPPRPGPATADPALGRPLGLAVRLLRGTVFWWSVGLLAMGLVYGSIADSVGDFVSDNDAMKDFVARSGVGTIVDAYLSTTLLILALIGAGYAVQASLRARSEEAALRAELVLATGVSRTRWMGSYLLVAAVGSVAVLGAGGFGVGLTYGIAIGDLGQVPRLFVAALTYLPAVWVLVSLTSALYGLVPRWSVAVWGAMTGCFVIGFFRQLLDLPQWVADLSPFEHVALVPGRELQVLPLLALAFLATGLTAAGLAGFHHRDIGA
jgi:ABC-2 type transport system permease protein